jgi:phosphoglycolate phosphatase
MMTEKLFESRSMPQKNITVEHDTIIHFSGCSMCSRLRNMSPFTNRMHHGSQTHYFDFDGTLADTFPWFVNTINEAVDKYRFKRFDRNNTDALRGLDMKQIMLNHEIPFWKLPFIVRHMQSLMKRDIADIPLFPGVEHALHDLSEKGATLAIVTSNSHENVLKVLGPEIAERFSYFEGASLFGKKAKLHKILAKSQIAPEAAILIGDEIRDAQAAMAAGISFGAVTWGYNHIDSLILHGVKEIFTHAGELSRKLIPGGAKEFM